MIGWMATVTAIIMFVSYIDQIRFNLNGQKGSVIQPAATVINCSFWTVYGVLKEKRDWPIIVANLPGIILGAAAFLTAI